jgi:polyhydroxybutyrate depolymerase
MKGIVWLALVAAGCGAGSSDSDGGGGDLAGAVVDLARGGDAGKPLVDLAGYDAPTDPLIMKRPYKSHVPTGYDPGKPTPLLVMLHGYASSGAQHEAYYQFIPLSDEHGFLYAYPDGTKDTITLQFWNATDACCNIFGSSVDDVAYLTAVIDDMSQRYNVDPKRIFFVGHSNGGFMSHRMACDRSSRIAAIVAQAGDNWKDVSKCKPTEPVAVLQIHGTSDPTIKYDGGQNAPQGPYPSAHASIGSWVTLNGCSATADTSAPAIDITSDIAGNETTKEQYPNCKGGAAELWTMMNAVHQPTLANGANELMWQFLAAHPKP